MPVRMSQDLFNEFVAGRVGPPVTIGGEKSRVSNSGTPRQKKPRAALPENQLESQVVSFLQARRWFVEKVHVGVFVPWYSLEAFWKRGQAIAKGMLAGGTVTRLGKKGDPDYRAWRGRQSGGVDLFLIECKAPGKKPEPDQIDRMRELRLTGAIVEWFDDFDFGGPHSFLDFYRRTFAQE